MAKTEIKLGVVRKIRTADFEQLDVISEITEFVEWKNEAERNKKIDKIIEHLMSDFRKAYNAITESIGVQRSLGTGKTTMVDGRTHSV